MQRKKRARHVQALLLLACTATCLPASVQAADQSYLNALENEAESMDSPEAAPQQADTAKPAGGAAKTAPREMLTKGMSMQAFENELQTNFFGSYLFYSKLSDVSKARVYQEYQGNNDVAYLREVIKNELTK